MKMKNPLDNLPPKARPYAMLVLALLPLLTVWAVYDDVVRQQSAEIERLQRAAPKQEDVAPAPGGTEPTIAPKPAAGGSVTTPFAAPTTEWRTAVSPDGTFQVSLPTGTKLLQSEDAVYVMADPTPRGALPIMAIKRPSAVDKQGYKPGTPTSVMLRIGTQDWWLYTWQYKAWAPFDRVVSSFKVL